MSLSGLCLVHCLVLPLAAALLPALGAWARAEWVHVLFVAIAAPLAIVALMRPAHGRAAPRPMLALGGLGVLCLAIGAFGPEAIDTPVTVAGSLALVSAHLWNWRRRGCPPAHVEAG
jgi:hypothetical protein